MARPLSEDKRIAILNSAAKVIAEQGITAPTSQIAREAGVAEGTLFKYFSNKEQLLNQLYLELKGEVAQELLSDYPLNEDLSRKAHHIWMSYVKWAIRNTDKRRAMQQLGVSNYLSVETRETTKKSLSEIESFLQRLADEERGISSEYIAAVMTALAETTVDFIMNNPAKAGEYCEVGFGTFWRGIVKK